MGYRVLRPAANAAISPLPSSISSSFIPSGRPGGTRIHPLGMLLASALWLGGNPSLSAAQAAVTPPAKASTAPASTAPSNREPAPTSASSAPEAKPASLANSGILTAPPGFNTSARTADVLAHLSAVIRFYRTAVVPIQTVGEPSDLLYREQTVTYSSQIANLAFQSAKAEASLIEQIQKLGGKSSSTTAETETQRLQANRNTVAEQIAALKDQDAALTKALVNARAKDRPALEGEQSRVEGALELQTQMADALGKVASMADSRS